MSAAPGVTEMLVAWSNGNKDALGQLMPLVYDELQVIASRHLRQESAGNTLQTTDLVHEAYLKLVDQTRVHWHNRIHFFRVAAKQMRRILVDHARSRNTAKRGGGLVKLSLDEAIYLPQPGREADLVVLDEAMEVFAVDYPRACEVIELHFFGGFNIQETAEVLEISAATVKRDLVFAKAWLLREVNKE